MILLATSIDKRKITSRNCMSVQFQYATYMYYLREYKTEYYTYIGRSCSWCIFV